MRILHVINALGSGGTERNLINYVNNDKITNYRNIDSDYSVKQMEKLILKLICKRNYKDTLSQ